MQLIRGFLTSENGATAIEYGLIVALISLAIVSALGATGTSVGDIWNDNANRVIETLGE
ncbi:Flp family type IVb pilin [Mesorhizobium sp. KR9-304]|uniref:Flp family type IVb pilin n=1 Tax=Mesorhizobium sp. KR9-304 TaxID=3156614 RepID=UPI0032B59680